MKWYMNWKLEDENGDIISKEGWANSWEEVVGYFTGWISKSNDVIEGSVVCYWGDNPYGNGKPCLYFNVYIDGDDNDDE